MCHFLVQIHTIDADDIRREKGTFTRDKNSLILKNIVTLGKDGNFCVKPSVLAKLGIEELKFTDIFAGPEVALSTLSQLGVIF